MKTLAALGMAALGLAGVVALELANLAASAPPPARPAATLTPHPAAAPPTATATWRATLLARPLFSPNRRPPAVAEAADGHGLPRLSGVLVAPTGRRALFASGIVAAEGSMVGPYKVQTIEAGRVTLLGPDGPHLLRPAFAPAFAPAGTAPPPHPRPAPQPAPSPSSPLARPK